PGHVQLVAGASPWLDHGRSGLTRRTWLEERLARRGLLTHAGRVIEDGSTREELPFGKPRPLDPDAFARVEAMLGERPPRELNALQRKRLWTGLSQDEFAAHVGVSRQTISSIENGRTTPSVRLALTIAAALEASVEELFGAGHDAVAPARMRYAVWELQEAEEPS